MAMAGYVADFESGEVPRAADFAALVAVVRDLLVAHGVFPGARCARFAGGARRVPWGTVARADAAHVYARRWRGDTFGCGWGAGV